MGKVFFNDWELWQKMTFVLACGIVVTVLLGLCKLQYDRYRIRKYTKVDKGKQAQTPEMLESQPVAREETKEEIPFGIRAIESGIEVDGVWISRSNTPASSRPSSINDFKLPKSQNNSQLELPAAILASSRNSSQAPSSFDRAVSAERIPTNDSRSSSPGRQNLYDARGRPIAANSRYSNSNIIRNSTALHALEGQDSGSPTSRYEPYTAQASSSNSGKSSIHRTSDETDYMNLQDGRPYEAAYINPSRHTSLAVPVDPRTDLHLLHNHRLSHVAETGQLTPRVRRPGNSGEWASVAENLRLPQEIATTNGVDYFVPQKTPSPPLAPNAGHSQETAAPLAPVSNQDGHTSNQARQAVPLLETYAPKAQLVPESYQPTGPGHQFSYETLPYEVQTEQNQREDHVIRKVNSGFEILRPGTFAPPSPEEEKSPNSEKRQSKRLQKKRRSSAGSRASNFVEQV
ncbi:hypothetical protein BS50DRAFT_177698 [Corynespora cassiicola Philippines]|uniref:Uncharacterized protein n=1 Tax=Corynespora cassiicola Philippines TaxID=1448308 RepID=A0A2T2P5W4_CORCC|nr:hypothetical protein BS50DRAFT_177698 [Corynespora cassiicola Philippines]